MEPLDAVILAGGRSRRLGADKALLPFGGEPLLRIIVDRVSRVCPRVFVAVDSAGRYEQLGLPVELVADVTPGHGPLSGLQVGLRACASQHALFLACDLPFLNTQLLRHMAQLPRSYQALVPRLEGRWHPLHAIYSRSVLPSVDAMLAAGGGSLRDLLARLDVRPIEEEELRPLDPDGLALLNLNAPADLRRARALWDGLRSREAAAN